MHENFSGWLTRVVPTETTARTKLSELRRVEATYGDLDSLYDEDELEGLLGELTYNTSDERANLPNPSRLAIDGNIRNNLASYKSAVQKYARFRQDTELEAARDLAPPAPLPAIAESEPVLSLEKDLNAALRANIGQLEPNLAIIDGGTERTVPSGRIDIYARNEAGGPVVIELKAVKAPRDAVAQVLAYMGDIQSETGQTVTGYLVAPEFDQKAISAARMAPALKLVTFAFQFTFTDVDKG